MNDIWSRSQFKRDLENLLNFRPPIGMSKIEALRHQAIQHSEVLVKKKEKKRIIPDTSAKKVSKLYRSIDRIFYSKGAT